MKEEYIKDVQVSDKTEEEKNQELLISIKNTRDNLENSHKNFEFAEKDLIDYYSYAIKANQAKMDYLIKQAKSKGLVVNN